MSKTPISLITGPLGSGKTTLLKNIMEQTDRRIAILMNEFGEIGIDSQIIQGHNIEIKELAGGCVCCSLTGEFEAAVKEIIDTIAPDMIILEATGVAEADALVFEVEDNLPHARLDTVICMVDAYTTTQFPQIGFVTAKQIESADILLINKIDLVTEDEVAQVERQIRKHNEAAPVLKTEQCRMDIGMIFEPSLERSVKTVSINNSGDSHSHVHNDHLESFFYTTDKTFDREKFRQFAQSLPEEVFRAKGFVRFGEETELFNYVMGRSDFEPFCAKKSQLVFIGPNLSSQRDVILEKLRKCETT